MIPIGGRYASATVLVDDSTLFASLTLRRHSGALPLGDTQLAQVDRIRCHLVRALQMHGLRQSVQPVSVAGHAMLEALPQGLVVVDATHRIKYQNPAFLEILAATSALVDRLGYLDGTDLQGSRQLAAAVRSLELGSVLGAAGGADRTLVRLTGSGGLAELLVHAIAVRNGPTMRRFGDEPCALLVVHRLDAAARLDPMIASLAFDLTPAEAQVSIAIAEGSSIEDVAAARGVSPNTIRAQLRMVFGKLGVRRQPDMVRMLLSLPRLRSRAVAMPQ